MTSYNKEPGPENNLNDYLLRLCGFTKETGMRSASPTILTKEHAAYVGNLMINWLPSLLETYSLDRHYSQIYSEVGYRDEGYVYEVITQEWGKTPDSIDMLAAGSLVEIAGPSSEEDYDKYLTGLVPKVIVNVDSKTNGANVLADAAHAPFRNESIGALFVSALPGAPREYLKQFATLRSDAITEAARMVQKEGYIIWLGGTSTDVNELIQNGFMPVYLETKCCMYKYTGTLNEQFKEPQLGVNGVYKKASE